MITIVGSGSVIDQKHMTGKVLLLYHSKGRHSYSGHCSVNILRWVQLTIVVQRFLVTENHIKLVLNNLIIEIILADQLLIILKLCNYNRSHQAHQGEPSHE